MKIRYGTVSAIAGMIELNNISNYLRQQNGLILVLGVAPLLAGANSMTAGVAMEGFFLTCNCKKIKLYFFKK